METRAQRKHRENMTKIFSNEKRHLKISLKRISSEMLHAHGIDVGEELKQNKRSTKYVRKRKRIEDSSHKSDDISQVENERDLDDGLRVTRQRKRYEEKTRNKRIEDSHKQSNQNVLPNDINQVENEQDQDDGGRVTRKRKRYEENTTNKRKVRRIEGKGRVSTKMLLQERLRNDTPNKEFITNEIILATIPGFAPWPARILNISGQTISIQFFGTGQM